MADVSVAAPAPSSVTSSVTSRRPAWRSASRTYGPEAAVVALALALDLWNLSVNGYGNTYYAAAVRSMSGSWHDFFYASVDPGGWITVDKPPLALWVQALSVRLFGYSSWSMLVPGALAGAGTVLLVMVIARRWDRIAGLVAGLALATMPVAVAVARSNNPDGMLVLLVTAAAAALLRAVETGRRGWLLGAAALVAAAFLTKLLVALVVLPALWLTYGLFAPHPWRRRLGHLVAGTGLLAVLSAGWVIAVDRTPLSSRPWIGGSTDGSAADLVLGYNGIGRITGAEQGPGGGGFPGGGGGGFGAFGGIDQFGGSPGITRLFNAGMGDQVMWLAPIAAAAALAGLYAVVRRFPPPERGHDAAGAVVVLLAGWAATAFVVLSFAKGIFHNYYVSLLAPAVAGLVGVGVAQLLRADRRGRALGAVAVALTAGLQLVLLRRVDAHTWLRPVVTVGLLVVAAGLGWSVWPGRQVSRRSLVGLTGAGVAVALVAPAVWSFAGDRYASIATFPDARPATTAASAAAAGPFGSGGFGGIGGFGGFGGAGLDEALLGWLRDQRDGERWIVAVGSVQQASGAIIAGDSVMPMGGFTGGDPAMTPSRLGQLVRGGDLRYVLAGASGPGGFGGFGGGGGIDAVVTSACTEVPASAWGGDQSPSGTLYDCKGKADAITEVGESTPSATDDPDTPGGGFGALEDCLADQDVQLPSGGGGGAPDLSDPDLLDALDDCGLSLGPGGPGGPGGPAPPVSGE